MVYKFTPQGNFTKIYQFEGSSNDGYNPEAIVQGSDGNFYGTTFGGSQVLCHSDCGSTFKLTLAGNLTTLHWFNGQDGNYPSGQLLQASDGNFYGTTSEGGAYTYGTVFKMTPTGTLTSLYSFCSDPQDDCPDGDSPASGVMQASDGTLYGTTVGTIFSITPSGNLNTLVRFQSGGPGGGLLQASNGNFYGLNGSGGTSNEGTVYQFYTTGKTLYASTSGNGTITSTDGIINCPEAALISIRTIRPLPWTPHRQKDGPSPAGWRLRRHWALQPRHDAGSICDSYFLASLHTEREHHWQRKRAEH